MWRETFGAEVGRGGGGVKVEGEGREWLLWMDRIGPLL